MDASPVGYFSHCHRISDCKAFISQTRYCPRKLNSPITAELPESLTPHPASARTRTVSLCLAFLARTNLLLGLSGMALLVIAAVQILRPASAPALALPFACSAVLEGLFPDHQR
jgi:hypothetical protein